VGSGGPILFVLGAAIAAAGFVAVVFGANKMLSPRDRSAAKESPYECGMPQQSEPNVKIRMRFVSIAVAFVIFDAESALLFAVADKLRGSVQGLAVVAVFAGLLAFGLVYAWRKGALEWRL